MAHTKTEFIENETLLRVTVHTPVMWEGLYPPQMHVVSYPNGRTYAVTEELLNLHFTIVRPQTIALTAHGSDGTDRPTPKQRQVERGDRIEGVVDTSALGEIGLVEDALTKARREAGSPLYVPPIEPLKE